MLTRVRIRKFLAQARDYIAAYFIFSRDNNTCNETYTKISKVDIDKMRKVYRSHRCIEYLEKVRCEGEASVIEGVV